MEGAGGGGSEASYEATDFGEAKRAHDKGGTHDTPQKKLTGAGGRVGAEACRLPRPCRLKADLTPPPPHPPGPALFPPATLLHVWYSTRASIPRHRGGHLNCPILQARKLRSGEGRRLAQGAASTGHGCPPAQVCRGQGSPEAVSPRRRRMGWGGSLPSTWIRRSLPRT